MVVPTIYLLYPHPDPAQSPHQEVKAYEAGGIDSDHWRAPIKPDFEKEEARWTGDEDAEDDIPEDSAVHGADRHPVKKPDLAQGVMGGSGGGLDDKVLSGGVIMPKLENATAK